MPYIKQAQRDLLELYIKQLNAELQQIAIAEGNVEPGIINYVITRILVDLKHKGNYNNHNALMGALESSKLEYYRRRVAPYEDLKIIENGDVYGD